MNVSELRERILDISHDESAPDNDLNDKALDWLNSAYHELIDELMPFLGRYLRQEESVITDSNGQATLSADVYRIMRTVDETNGRTLKEMTREDVLDVDPTGQHTGAPIGFYIEGAKLTLYPRTSVDLTVLYLPEVADLTEDDGEDEILLPRQFHHVLVWGALVWSSIYERGFGTQSDLTLFQRKWEEAKRNAKLSLASQPSGTLRVQSFDVV